MVFLKFSFKRLVNSIRLLFSYSTFFKGDIIHFQNLIHDYMHHSYDITFDEVIKKTRSKNIFLKVDIEGSEYRITDAIMKYSGRINAIAIEFHNANALKPIFISNIKKLQRKFKIVHLHANNYAGYGKDGLPECPEITLINNKINIQTYGKRKLLPLNHLDFQCAPKKLIIN